MEEAEEEGELEEEDIGAIRSISAKKLVTASQDLCLVTLGSRKSDHRSSGVAAFTAAFLEEMISLGVEDNVVDNGARGVTNKPGNGTERKGTERNRVNETKQILSPATP